MGVHLDSAARRLCEHSGWSMTNLELQKLLYLAQVEHAGMNDGDELVRGPFEAWDYGPVIPNLYRRLKVFGASDVSDVFPRARHIRDESPSATSLDRTWDQFGGAAPGELVQVTHWERGGWAQRYEPGIRSIRIRQEDIIAEAENRRRFRNEWQGIVA